MKTLWRFVFLALWCLGGLGWANSATARASQTGVASTATLASSQNLRFEHLTVEDGLPHATVLSVLQDQDGFMWFATADGITRYDGVNFTTFRHDLKNLENSLSNNNTFALIQTRDGRIWIGTDPGGLNVYDPKTGKFQVYRHDPKDAASLADDSIWSLLEDRDGRVWAGTRNGLSRLDLATNQFTNYLPDPENPRALAGPLVYRIYQDHSGVIWVGTRNGLQRYDPATDDFTLFANDLTNPASLSSNQVWAMLEDSQGNFWVGTRRGGLNLFDRQAGTFKAYKNDPDDPTSISNDNVWFIFEDSAANLWVTTENGGLNLFDRQAGRFTSYRYNPNNSFSISNDDLFWMTEDRSGVLWIASRYGGVNKLYPSLQRFGLYRSIVNDPSTLSSSNVYSILAEPDGIVWIGTFGGGLNRFDRKTGKMQVYKNDPLDPTSISNDKIYSIHRDPQGVLWVTTSGGGLNRMDPVTGAFTAYRYSADDPGIVGSSYLTTIKTAGDHWLWVGTLGYGLDLFDTTTGRLVKEYEHKEENPNGLTEGTVYDLAVESSGRVWVATARGGLEQLDPQTDTFTHHLHDPDNPNSIASDTVHAVYVDEAAGIVWAATAGGLSRLDIATGQWKNYTIHDGLTSDTVVAVQPGADGQIWISTTRGLSRLDLKTETFRNYDAADGLQGNQYAIAGSHRGPDGELFFGGPNGLTFFYPEQIVDDTAQGPAAWPVVFTDFQLFNQSVPVGSELLPQAIQYTKKLELDYSQSVFTFEFAALSYSMSSKNLYQYKMDGFDKDWSPPRRQSNATYTNLAPGSYTFWVRASNHDQQWNINPAKIEIVIHPPWWQTWWFRLAVSMAALALVMGVVHWRIRSISATNHELEKRVKERTQELQAEVHLRQNAENKLSQLNEELQAQLDQITDLQKDLHEQAIRDALTGLYNRRYLAEMVNKELLRAERHQYSVAFVLVDLDHFKNINDTYGHQAGDVALIEAANLLCQQTRRSDVACRYGGEEFLLMLPETGLEDAHRRAEDLRRTIEQTTITHGTHSLQLTASIGVAVYPNHGRDMDELFKNVDLALYQSKDDGRNRVSVFEA
jgi:diguanylate cyclase (GGDEF)-like protein